MVERKKASIMKKAKKASVLLPTKGFILLKAQNNGLHPNPGDNEVNINISEESDSPSEPPELPFRNIRPTRRTNFVRNKRQEIVTRDMLNKSYFHKTSQRARQTAFYITSGDQNEDVDKTELKEMFDKAREEMKNRRNFNLSFTKILKQGLNLFFSFLCCARR
jgi:hypothetical protein